MQIKFLSVTIIIIVLSLISTIALFVVQNAISGETNIDIFRKITSPCESFKINKSNKTAILRIDDIQASWHDDISKKMVEDALSHQAPTVLGIIPIDIESNKKLYSYLRDNRCNIEIAQHGWDHRNNKDRSLGEFETLSEEEAYNYIIKGKKILERLFYEPVISFIPPNNIYSSGTANALGKAKFTIISSEGDSPFDYHASMYDYPNNIFKSADAVIGECEERFKENDLCVIMLHPQEFTTNDIFDSVKYEEYLKILDELSKRNVSFIRFKDLAL